MSNPLMASIHLIRAADPPTNKPNVQVGRRTRPLRYLGAYGLSRGVGRLNMLVTRCNGVKLCENLTCAAACQTPPHRLTGVTNTRPKAGNQSGPRTFFDRLAETRYAA